MFVTSSPYGFNEDQLYVDLEPTLGSSVYLKIEGLNFAGSVKVKAALEMVEHAERAGLLRPDSIIVESSSGNLGVALSMICASKGYEFLCVVDPRCNPSTKALMETLGARVHQVDDPHPTEGFLGARLHCVRSLCATSPRYVWLNQYESPENWGAHYRRTGPEIAAAFPNLDVLFVGAGTTGTLMGCARYFKDQGHPARIVAVDAVGSVSFGGPPARRLLPGLGMGVVPPQLDAAYVDEVVMVEEVDTIRACHLMASRGFLFGASTGTVVAGAIRWLIEHGSPQLTAVALSPDLGGRYLDTLYSTDWLLDNYGADILPDRERAPLQVRAAA